MAKGRRRLPRTFYRPITFDDLPAGTYRLEDEVGFYADLREDKLRLLIDLLDLPQGSATREALLFHLLATQWPGFRIEPDAITGRRPDSTRPRGRPRLTRQSPDELRRLIAEKKRQRGCSTARACQLVARDLGMSSGHALRRALYARQKSGRRPIDYAAALAPFLAPPKVETK